MRPYIHNPDSILSTEPTSERASQLQASAQSLPAPSTRVSGLFSKQHKLPRDCGWLARELQALSDQLTQAVAAKHGEVSIYHSALIESALKHHKRLRLLERWLIRPLHQPRRSGDDLTSKILNRTSAIPLAERIQLVKEEALATDARAKAIQQLGLDGGSGDATDWGKVFAAGIAQGVANGIKAGTAIESGES